MQHGVKTKDLLSLNYKESEAVRVSPVGEIAGIDGRKYSINANTVLASIKANSLHIPLDENHSFGAAIGWFDKNSFEEREDGIYAKLELNQIGKELVKQRAYRYLSPVFETNGTEVIGLDSIGFVNRPNLLKEEINSKGDSVNIDELTSKNEALEKELNEIKAKNEALEKELNESKKEENKKEQSEVAKEELKELNSRLDKLEDSFKAIFGKKELEKNSKSTSLSDAESKMLSLLGLSENEYKGAK